jgi:5-methylcytosine-specific restriction protein B
MNIQKIHEEILNRLLQFQELYPSFTFWLRRKKDGLQNGMKFQGNDNYVSIGLVATDSGNLSTKSIALQIDITDNKFKGSILLMKRNLKSDTNRDFYLAVSELMTEKKPGIEWRKDLDSSGGIETIFEDFKDFYPIFHSLVVKYNLQNEILISQADFSKSLKKVEEFQALLKNPMSSIHSSSQNKTSSIKYWLYAPGKNANMWGDFLHDGEMGLGWDKLGDLKKYTSRIEIKEALLILYQGEGSKMNDVSANDDFLNKMQIGDVIIAKKGRSAYLGYGVVSSEYFFDEQANNYKSKRKVSWIKNGVWNAPNADIVLKTLTDITKYPEYVESLRKLIGIEMEERKINVPNNQNPINQILYGPPGTGKTFTTIDLVIDILEPYNNYTRIQKKAKFEVLVNENRAFFTTFHQSMSYEEFIEGIKPKTVKDQVQYEITNGILKDICDLCFEDIKEMKAHSISESFELSFKEKFQEFGKAIQQGIIELKTRSGITVQISKISSAGNLQLNSGEDTRDYVISMKRLEKLAKAFPNPSVIKNIHEEIRVVIGGSNSSLYFAALEAFISFEKKITETVKKDGKEISLSEIQLSEEEIAALPPYFLIIDEINRGNVSAIFGELITLIEEDKRFGKTNQLFVKLPYSREEFILPPNLYIIGTMNTADRSVEALDTALRRRFSFVEMLPDASKLENKQIEGIDLALLLNTLNERIEVLVDRDHTIGHAFFMNIESLADLRSAFANKIVPLLQEYFYGNYRKMEMVIGSTFFNITEANKVKFAVKSDDFDADGTVYHIKNISHADGMPDTVFIEALNQLIKGA